MAERLNFSLSVPTYGYELTAYTSVNKVVSASEKEYTVSLVQGVSYDIVSGSYYDPVVLRIASSSGTILRSDTGFIGDYGDDYILGFVAPYTGDYKISTGWDQGSFFTFADLGVFGDIDSLNISTKFGTINRFDSNAGWDRSFYLNTYSDMKTIADPLSHYMNTGWKEGRDPNAWFDTDAYLAANPDVRAAGVNPLTHYMTSGWKEGRDPGPNFDVERYLTANPDVRAAGIDPLGHWIDFGRAEGRAAPVQAVGNSVQQGFDAQYYLMTNQDVARAGIDPWAHYLNFGAKEGRDPNAWFDTDGYLATYTDVRAAGVNPLQHYMANGWKEGRDPSTAFDTGSYLSNYADVRAAGLNPLEHFLQFGLAEGRQAFGDGNWL